MSATRIAGGTFTIGSGGIETIVGSFNPANLNAGVIMQVVGSSGSPVVGIYDSGVTTIANTTFTSTNNTSFDTDAVVILLANAFVTDNNATSNIATRFMQSTTVKAVTATASASSNGSSKTTSVASKIQLSKDTVYHCDVSWNNGFDNTFGGGIGSVIVLEVRRV